MFPDVVTNAVQLVYSFSSEVSHHLALKVGGLWRFFWMSEKSRHLKNNYILCAHMKIAWNLLPKYVFYFNQGCIVSQHYRFGREHIFFQRRSYGNILKTSFQTKCGLKQL